MSDLMNVTSTPIPSVSSLPSTDNLLTTATGVLMNNISLTSPTAPIMMLSNLSTVTTTAATATTAATTTISSIIINSGSHLKFNEDGLREPPSFTAPANLIIIIVGLSILIVPVVCVFIAICARTRVFLKLKDMKFSSGDASADDDDDDSKLPYSQFNNPSPVPNPSKPKNLKISSDIRVLIDNDNVTPGSPGSQEDEVPNDKKKESRVLIRSSESADGLDATFIVPGCSSSNNRSPAILKLDS